MIDYRHFRSSVRKQAHWLAFIAAATVSLSAFMGFRHLEQRARVAEFSRRCQVAASLVQLELRAEEDALYSLRSLFLYSDFVSRAEFAGMATDMIQRYPAITKLEWVARVPGEQRAAFELAQRAAGAPHYTIHDWTPDASDTQPAPARPVHLAVVYSHPLKSDANLVLGYDLMGSPAVPDLELAAAGNRTIASSRRPLDQTGLSVVMSLPVFRWDSARQMMNTAVAPEGFVMVFSRARDLVRLASERMSLPDCDLLVVDASAEPGNRSIYYHSNLSELPPAESEFRQDSSVCTISISLASRTWDLLFRPRSGSFEHRPSLAPLAVLGIGLLASGLLGYSLRNSFRRTELVERAVLARTAEVRRTQQLLEEDIRHRQAAEAAFQASEARLQAIIDHSPSLIFVKDLAGRYLLTNRAYRAIFGLPDDRRSGFSDADLFPPEEVQGFTGWDQRVLASREAAVFEESITKHSGEKLSCLTVKFPLYDHSDHPYAICGIATDITERLAAARERTELDQRIQEKQRLESLGVLAGGIAHDFNNILTAILGNASLARLETPPESPLDTPLQQIEHAARRAADLCAQMLAYAGQGRLVSSAVDLSSLVRDTATLLEVSVRKSTRLHLELGAGLPPVHGDATQLRQIVMNLVINAAEAIGTAPGEITLKTSLVQAEPALFRQAVQSPDLPAGPYLSMEIRDSGCGMPPATLARIFDPFFTTKFTGRGLGLAAVLGIVRSHDGALFVESQPGNGSTFRLLLPAAPSVDQPAAAAPSSTPAQPAPLQGRVLVVDDEDQVRSLTRMVLQRAGLQTLEARDGHEAVKLCQQTDTKIDLVLLDLNMPGLSGEETLRRLRTEGRKCPIVLMSGYHEDGAKSLKDQFGPTAFLNKPFEVGELIAVIRRYLPSP